MGEKITNMIILIIEIIGLTLTSKKTINLSVNNRSDRSANKQIKFMKEIMKWFHKNQTITIPIITTIRMINLTNPSKDRTLNTINNLRAFVIIIEITMTLETIITIEKVMIIAIQFHLGRHYGINLIFHPHKSQMMTLNHK